ncbi:MAG: hypothetical protein A3C85_00355 [Candidatus Doudnabacteria bacterium RIFCSPHIGHO2_02_FULL_48_21]|uniref:Uncharacterized protein n=1 Tax=Candidatus Doudnabacteria bacterium RIFCSPLOWO2_02_FULL_48_13 TaxID=1817845 RepID=A0A1F5QDK6_9BACT|nr:MAG: hypothetical protein A3K05_01185 [Candidatus Doudnabacteria bacterium RIFCSPHIGHO2_01_48_18]OGE79166.1 MAG: hypothetical protein A2668_00305 [Candidatus Doudnabacteria bacterium RIFCSPHIGHO2_01_FULL_48_180]OGE91798.1 MAG: hypothetical protein A3F44_00865 [Candidatus Doudnabacteria bacterium RIFCSPHIGHO2_12_FULL_47_25]OGE93648.1 MAG: hypothetical protein A3C85_00355 [Candidatus Doudnabacteria bacterium RIFCSPHIGHO2_02_FULL_48_21]OGE97929.1 MAG: hypothetical protein A3A83_00540 [Candidatu
MRKLDRYDLLDVISGRLRTTDGIASLFDEDECAIRALALKLKQEGLTVVNEKNVSLTRKGRGLQDQRLMTAAVQAELNSLRLRCAAAIREAAPTMPAKRMSECTESILEAALVYARDPLIYDLRRAVRTRLSNANIKSADLKRVADHIADQIGGVCHARRHRIVSTVAG